MFLNFGFGTALHLNIGAATFERCNRASKHISPFTGSTTHAVYDVDFITLRYVTYTWLVAKLHFALVPHAEATAKPWKGSTKSTSRRYWQTHAVGRIYEPMLCSFAD